MTSPTPREVMAWAKACHARALCDHECPVTPCLAGRVGFDASLLAALVDVREAAEAHLADLCGECAIHFCEDDSAIGCALSVLRATLTRLEAMSDE